MIARAGDRQIMQVHRASQAIIRGQISTRSRSVLRPCGQLDQFADDRWQSRGERAEDPAGHESLSSGTSAGS